MFYPSYSSASSYSYSYPVLDNRQEEKNNNPKLLNKIIEPIINSVSLKKVDLDIDDKDVVCFENDDKEIVCFDKDKLDSNDLDDLNIDDIEDLLDISNNNNDLKCFENDDDETVCFDKNAINNDDSLFGVD